MYKNDLLVKNQGPNPSNTGGYTGQSITGNTIIHLFSTALEFNKRTQNIRVQLPYTQGHWFRCSNEILE